MFKLKRTLRFIALFLAINILVECVAPSVAMALTSGPAQPEFASFEPVATTNMVDPFTGSFTYNLPVINVPGPNGGGYGVSLSYHSGAGMEEEASWVGAGWTLNPGAIMRNKSGFEDDVKGGKVSYDYNQPKIFTLSAGNRVAGDLFGVDTKYSTSVSVGTTRTFNSYKGFGRTTSVSAAPLNGIVSLSFSVGDGEHCFMASVNPGQIVQFAQKQDLASKKKRAEQYVKNVVNRSKAGKMLKKQQSKLLHSNYGITKSYEIIRPTSLDEFSSYAISLDFSLGIDPAIIPVGIELGAHGNYNEQFGKKSSKFTYGNMYLKEGIEDKNNSGTTIMLDYFVEKESNYNKRDLFLSIPYQGCDVYSVMGEGIGGGFKYTLDDVGNYFPSVVKSNTTLLNASVEVALGTNVKPATGIGYGVGYHLFESKSMFGGGNYDNYRYNKTDGERDFDRERGYFRFNGDLSNGVNHTSNYSDAPVAANVNNFIPFYKITNINAPLLQNQEAVANESKRAYRSSYVGYSTISQLQSTNNVFRLKSYTRDAATRTMVLNNIPSHSDIDNSKGVVDNQIGEMYTVNEDGNTYVYGLPVFSCFDKSVAEYLNVKTANMGTENVINSLSNSSSVKAGNAGGDAYRMIEKNLYPYVNAHLLTQIITPDYIDRTFDGPTPDDFGGWTKFNYKPGTTGAAYSDVNSWYDWRTPVVGYDYNRGTLSHTIDDMLGYTEGKKQQYFLESIETKTHIAFFVTNETNASYINELGETILIKGSGVKRVDAVSASATANKTTVPNPDAGQTSRKLEKVILFAKSVTSNVGGNGLILAGKPLKVANLEYYGYRTDANTAATDVNSALCKNLPNVLPNQDNLKGKLTLKRIWFEYEGIVNAKISPYEFFYEYKTDWVTALPAELRTKYASIVNFADPTLVQNPNYNPLNIDPWGNYMEDGVTRKLKFNETISQVNQPSFDPAAWQLKRIVLPSGGEILVNYEQGDYKYVHDQNATAMVSLDPTLTSSDESGSSNDKKYYLNLADLGITTQADINDILPVIDKYLKDHKIYFKFLYSLNGTTTNVADCNVEYITGYAKAEVKKDDSNGKLYIQFSSSPNTGFTLPYKVCRDFNSKERKGLNLQSDCSFPKRIPFDVDGTNTSKILSAIWSLLAKPDDLESSVCKTMSLTDSYLRIPVLQGKKGGGVRVKHVLMYDPGLETGDQMLYGNEYIYKLADNKTSSGVATNEPNSVREENVLVDFLQKRADKFFIDKISSGRDKEQFEGPIGEALLTAPSVGYSRVVVKNIHSEKTNTGFTVYEFHTVKDHPISKWVTTTNKKGNLPMKIKFGAVIVSTDIDQRYESQGYSFVLYDIHGKPKRLATYKGNYDQTSSVNQELSNYLSYEEISEYTKPGEFVTVMDYAGQLRSIPLGRNEEVAMEMRNVSEYVGDFSMKGDLTVGLAAAFPIPFVTGMPNLGFRDIEMNTHVINKVIRYEPILKKQIVKKDGVYHSTEHKVFAISNGKPLVSVSYDGFNALDLNSVANHKGAYTNYTVPADYFYKGMSGKFKNENLNYTIANASITDFDVSNKKYVLHVPFDVIDKGYCTTGDLINIENNGIYYVLGYEKTVSEYVVIIQFANALGQTFTAPAATGSYNIYVIHSGFANQLNTPAASVLTYGDNPATLTTTQFVTLSGGERKLKAFSNALQLSTQTYQSDWSNSLVNQNYNVPDNINDYLAGRAGKWRPFETFTQKKAISGSSIITTTKTYDGGLFSSDIFDYNPAVTNTLWTKTNTITIYSPDGNALEEKNILNIYSAVKFGHNETVPVLVAKNAPYKSIYFNGFEEYPVNVFMGVTYNQFMPQTVVSKQAAHTGIQSMKVGAGGRVNLTENRNSAVSTFAFYGAEQIFDKGALLRMWVKTPDKYYDSDVSTLLTINTFNPSNPSAVLSKLSVSKIAQVGEWTLVEGVLPKNILSQYMSCRVEITNTTDSDMFVDDIRVQPYDAEMACYVYDSKNLRLLASFDDQHFALIYQYNAEGKLLRKLIETEKGVKTITEAQYNTPQKTY